MLNSVGGKVLHFPRDNDCNVVYCNIEGIAFINDRMIVAGKAPFFN